VDATVEVPALTTVLMRRLPSNGSELVVFDLNRTGDVQYFLEHDHKAQLERLLGGGAPDFTLTFLTNATPSMFDVVARTRRAGAEAPEETPLGLAWPASVFSLAHVALPFPPTDALYGPDAPRGPTISIGRLVLHGEKGVLRVPAADMLRIRWNPFYPYLEGRLLEFVAVP
jgi:hypothetical protein